MCIQRPGAHRAGQGRAGQGRAFSAPVAPACNTPRGCHVHVYGIHPCCNILEHTPGAGAGAGAGATLRMMLKRLSALPPLTVVLVHAGERVGGDHALARLRAQPVHAHAQLDRLRLPPRLRAQRPRLRVRRLRAHTRATPLRVHIIECPPQPATASSHSNTARYVSASLPVHPAHLTVHRQLRSMQALCCASGAAFSTSFFL